jgi:DNA polymerase III delta subunit
MLFANLRESLKTEIKPAYTLAGADIFLINKSIELILTAAKIEPLNVIYIEEDATPADINAALCNVSMFGDANAVVVRGAEARVILQPNTKSSQPVDCNPMTEDLVVRLILNTKRFTPDAARFLAQCCENNYARVNNEMEKLLSYHCDKTQIGRADVDKLVTKTENYQIYELSNALLKRDIVRADKIVKTLDLCGVDEYAVFGSLVSLLRRCFYGFASNAPDAAIANFLKVHPYSVTSARRDGKHLRENITQIYAQALDLEYQIKSGKIGTRHAIFLIQGLLV